MDRSEIIYELLKLIPKGWVSTYTAMAKASGINNPRSVGSILHKNKNPRLASCYKVVNARGQLAVSYAFGGAKAQMRLLKNDSVPFLRGRVDIAKCLWVPSDLVKAYLQLLYKYGRPGPWPWFSSKRRHANEEIVIGAILTQNTNWRNVESALENLRREKIVTLRAISDLTSRQLPYLKSLIRPSGFYNQKGERLYLLSRYIIKNYSTLRNFFKLPLNIARLKLLSLSGIGPETADTMLLFAGNKLTFTIDNYTKIFVRQHGLSSISDDEGLKKYFESNLPEKVGIYKDFHALIVRWGKERTNKRSWSRRAELNG